MAGAGFKTFGVGDVLTASDVNTYLMEQAVMAFADSGARGSAIGTATEGMVSYLADTDAVEVYDGSAWTAVGGGGGFTASTAITATDASWSVPTLADPVVKVTVVGGGGGGGQGRPSSGTGGAGSAGGSSSFACSAGTATAAGGAAGVAYNNGGSQSGPPPDNTNIAANFGLAGNPNSGAPSPNGPGSPGVGGSITTAYFDLTGVTTANVTVGAGGAGGTGTNAGDGQPGGDGVVIVEYRAG